MTFAENLKRICTDRGTTPTALLRKMGVATSKVAMWNSGSLPKQEMMVRLAKELGCSVMDFFADYEDILPSAYTGIELDEDEKELVRIFRALGRREKHEFMSTAYDYEKRAEIQGNSGTNDEAAI